MPTYNSGADIDQARHCDRLRLVAKEDVGLRSAVCQDSMRYACKTSVSLLYKLIATELTFLGRESQVAGRIPVRRRLATRCRH
jgi:hypothetical protein